MTIELKFLAEDIVSHKLDKDTILQTLEELMLHDGVVESGISLDRSLANIRVILKANGFIEIESNGTTFIRSNSENIHDNQLVMIDNRDFKSPHSVRLFSDESFDQELLDLFPGSEKSYRIHKVSLTIPESLGSASNPFKVIKLLLRDTLVNPYMLEHRDYTLYRRAMNGNNRLHKDIKFVSFKHGLEEIYCILEDPIYDTGNFEVPSQSILSLLVPESRDEKDIIRLFMEDFLVTKGLAGTIRFDEEGFVNLGFSEEEIGHYRSLGAFRYGTMNAVEKYLRDYDDALEVPEIEKHDISPYPSNSVSPTDPDLLPGILVMLTIILIVSVILFNKLL